MDEKPFDVHSWAAEHAFGDRAQREEAKKQLFMHLYGGSPSIPSPDHFDYQRLELAVVSGNKTFKRPGKLKSFILRWFRRFRRKGLKIEPIPTFDDMYCYSEIARYQRLVAKAFSVPPTSLGDKEINRSSCTGISPSHVTIQPLPVKSLPEASTDSSKLSRS